jgi:hypothetical protein
LERFVFSSEPFQTFFGVEIGSQKSLIPSPLQSLNGVKLVLPIIFAMLLKPNPVACLGLAAALLGCTLLYSLMYGRIYGNPPGTSTFLWCVWFFHCIEFIF